LDRAEPALELVLIRTIESAFPPERPLSGEKPDRNHLQGGRASRHLQMPRLFVREQNGPNDFVRPGDGEK